MNASIVLTTCPYCGCGCNLYLEAINGVLTGVTPCPTDRVSEGKLCIKGRNAHAFVQSKDRLTKPLIKKDGQFQEASWDQALTLVAQKLNDIKKDTGPDSIGLVACARATNEDNYTFAKFARAVIGTNNIDHCARL